jgi:large subunit ribosomal protein L15
MYLHELAPAPGSKRERRRVGRGHGSGRGKTAGKGTKGQNSRAGGGTKLFFEGGQNPWTMKIPHKRGFSNRRFRRETQIVNLRDVEKTFASGDVVNPAALRQRGLIGNEKVRVKLLGEGQLSKQLSLTVHAASGAAQAAVERAGGSVTLLEKPRRRPTPAPKAKPSAAAEPEASPAASSES